MLIKVINEAKLSPYISSIAAIHKKAYNDDHFTSTFSLRKLEDYYRFLIKNSDLSLIGIDNQGACAGFIISGTTVSKGIQEFIRVNRMYLIGIMLKNPSFLIQKLYHRAHALFKTSKTSSAKFRLLSISVNPSLQSKGVGGLLLNFFESKLTSMNINSYGLSVRSDNKRAVKFYINNGFLKEICRAQVFLFFKNIKIKES